MTTSLRTFYGRPHADIVGDTYYLDGASLSVETLLSLAAYQRACVRRPSLCRSVAPLC